MQHRSIVETVGLFPRFIMLEIMDCEIFASFASWYFDHPHSSRNSVIRAIKSISFTTSPHFNFIRKVRISVRTNRLDNITMLLHSVPYAESTRFRLRNLVLSFLSSDSFTDILWYCSFFLKSLYYPDSSQKIITIIHPALLKQIPSLFSYYLQTPQPV